LIIAIVLASGTAASALLDTVQESAEVAEAVTAEAVEGIVLGLTIREISGRMEGGTLVEVRILVAPQAGSPSVDLRSLVVQLVTPGEDAPFAPRDYAIEEVLSNGPPDGMLARGEMATISFDVAGGPGPGEEATISVHVPRGQSTTARTTVPNAITDGLLILR